MADTKPMKTLVEVMRETGWWPEEWDSELDSESEGEISGQIVVLDEAYQLDNYRTKAWKLHPQMSYESCPYPSKMYALIYQRPGTLPMFCRVLVADKSSGSINPLTDCCALVPFDPLIDEFGALTPKGRVQLGQQAIEACLKLIGEWPVQTVTEMFSDHTRLEPGQQVNYDPAEWIIDGEDMFRDEFVRAYHMVNKRAKVALVLVISAPKEDHPESIDPYRDCCAKFVYPKLARRIGLFLRGLKAPPKHTIPDLERGAIAALLDSLGAWPPGRDIKTHKPTRLEIRELLKAAISKLERFNPPSVSEAGANIQLNIQFFKSMLAKHEDKPVHNNTGMAIDSLRSLNTSLDKASSLHDVEEAFTRYHADLQELAVKVKGQHAGG